MTNCTNCSSSVNWSSVFPCTQRFPYNCPVTVTVIIIFALGFVGNLVVVITMIRRELKHSKTFQMSICVLAISDLLSLLCNIGQELVFYPNIDYFEETIGFSNTFCLTSFIIFYTPYLWSSWNVVFMAYERYVLVTDAFKYITTHTGKLVLIRSVIGLLVLLVINTTYAIIMSQTKECPSYIMDTDYYSFISIPVTFTALIALVILHCAKLWKIKRCSMKRNQIPFRQMTSRMTKVVYVIVTVYILSQIPYVIYDILNFCETRNLIIVWPEENYNILLSIGVITFSINYAINPFLYSLVQFS